MSFAKPFFSHQHEVGFINQGSIGMIFTYIVITMLPSIRLLAY